MGRPRKNDESVPGTPNRLSIPLTPEGLVDWASLRGSTKERLTSVIDRDTTVNAAQWGIGESDESEPDNAASFGVTEENVAAALDLVGQLNALMFRVGLARFVKHPLKRDMNGKPLPLTIDTDIAAKCFKLTKEQHAELDPRAARLAKKYTPEWAKKNMDAYMLVAMYLRYTAENAKTAIGMQIQRDVLRAANLRATGPKVTTSMGDAVPVTTNEQPVNGHAQSGTSNTVEGASLEPGGTEAFDQP